jgi:hypothetical protein
MDVYAGKSCALIGMSSGIGAEFGVFCPEFARILMLIMGRGTVIIQL